MGTKEERLELKQLKNYPDDLMGDLHGQTVRLLGFNSDWAKGGAHLHLLIPTNLKSEIGVNSGRTIYKPLYYSGVQQFKPYLRSLSQLTQEIEYNGKKEVVIENLYQSSVEEIENAIFNGELAIAAHQYLIERHFDVFGLIPRGLANEKTV